MRFGALIPALFLTGVACERGAEPVQTAFEACNAEVDTLRADLAAAEQRLATLEEDLNWVTKGREEALGNLAKLDEVLSFADGGFNTVVISEDLRVDGIVQADAAEVELASVERTQSGAWTWDGGSDQAFLDPQISANFLVTVASAGPSATPLRGGLWIVEFSNSGTCLARELTADSAYAIDCRNQRPTISSARSDAGTTLSWVRLQ